MNIFDVTINFWPFIEETLNNIIYKENHDNKKYNIFEQYDSIRILDNNLITQNVWSLLYISSVYYRWCMFMNTSFETIIRIKCTLI